MLLRIRREIFKPGEFEKYEERRGLTKDELCFKYRLSPDTTVFYGSDGKLIESDFISGTSVIAVQAPAAMETVAGTAITEFGKWFISAVIAGAVSIGTLALTDYMVSQRKTVDPSYSYTVRGATNQVRANLPVGILLGQANVCGDLAGLPYSSYINNKQYLHQVFSLGYSLDASSDKSGGVVVEKDSHFIPPSPHEDWNPKGYKIHIGDTPIDLYSDFNVDVKEGADKLSTYYNQRVIEDVVSVKLTDDWVQRTTATNTTTIKVGIIAPYGYYKATDKGERESLDYEYVVRYRLTTSESESDWVSRTISGSMSNTEYRNFVEFNVLAGQYDVQVKNERYTDTPDTSECGTLEWDILQSYTATTTGSYAPINNTDRYTLLSMRIKGTDQVNGYVDKLYAKSHLICRTYTGDYSETDDYESKWNMPYVATMRTIIQDPMYSDLLDDNGNPKSSGISPYTNVRKYTISAADWPVAAGIVTAGTVTAVLPLVKQHVLSSSVTKWVVYPAIRNGVLRTEEVAWADYTNNGIYLGIFDTQSEAENYAQVWEAFDAWKVRNHYDYDSIVDLPVGDMNNPAAILLYILTDPKVNPRPIPSDKIDWISLRDWFKFCKDREWSCNAWVTEQLTIGELAQRVCSTGRAQFTLNDGKYGVVIEDANKDEQGNVVVSQLFTPRNAWSMHEVRDFTDRTTLLNTSFVNADTEQEENFYVYITKDPRSQKDVLRFETDGAKIQEQLYKSESINLWGVTNPKQAQQLAAYKLVYTNRLVRTYTWDCGLESIMSSVGDVVYLANDIFMYSLGYGRISEILHDTITNKITGVIIDDGVIIDPTKSYGITVRKNNGTFESFQISRSDSTSRKLMFVTPVDADTAILEGNLFMYGDSSVEGKKVKITEIKPTGDRNATITAVDYIPEIYTIDIDTTIPTYESNISKPGTGATGASVRSVYPIPALPISASTYVQFGYGGATAPYEGSAAGWTTDPLIPRTTGEYIWQRVGTYTPPQTPEDITDWTIYRVSGPEGQKGDPGSGATIVDHSVTYQNSTSGTTTPTGTWSSNPNPEIGKYLWTKTYVKYSDDTETISYAVSYSGEDGAGVTISSKSIKYQNSTSGTVTPTGTWTDNPSPILGQYTWTRTIVNYSDGTSTTAYSVAYAGTNGTDGTVVVVQYSKGLIDRPYASVVVGYDTADPDVLTGTDNLHILGRNTWTTEQIDESTLVEDEYIWMRIGSYIPPQTEADIDNWRISRITGRDGDPGDPGTPAYVFSLRISSQTYIRNLRQTGAQPDIVITASIQGYTGSCTLSVTSGGTLNKTTLSDGQSANLTINYINSVDSITVTGTLAGAEPVSFTLAVVDETQYNKSCGTNDITETPLQPPTRTVDDEILVKGDYFVANAPDGSFTYEGVTFNNGQVYRYTGSTWEYVSFSSENSSMFLNSLVALKKAGVNFSTISDPNSISWFTDLVADTIITNAIMSNKITMTGDALIQSQSWQSYADPLTSIPPVKGYRLSGKTGAMSANELKVTNLYADGNTVIKGEIDNPRFKTIAAGTNVINFGSFTNSSGKYLNLQECLEGVYSFLYYNVSYSESSSYYTWSNCPGVYNGQAFTSIRVSGMLGYVRGIGPYYFTNISVSNNMLIMTRNHNTEYPSSVTVKVAPTFTFRATLPTGVVYDLQNDPIYAGYNNDLSSFSSSMGLNKYLFTGSVTYDGTTYTANSTEDGYTMIMPDTDILYITIPTVGQLEMRNGYGYNSGNYTYSANKLVSMTGITLYLATDSVQAASIVPIPLPAGSTEADKRKIGDGAANNFIVYGAVFN